MDLDRKTLVWLLTFFVKVLHGYQFRDYKLVNNLLHVFWLAYWCVWILLNMHLNLNLFVIVRGSKLNCQNKPQPHKDEKTKYFEHFITKLFLLLSKSVYFSFCDFSHREIIIPSTNSMRDVCITVIDNFQLQFINALGFIYTDHIFYKIFSEQFNALSFTAQQHLLKWETIKVH